MGTGSVARHIAMVAKIFGMKVLGFHTTSDPVEHFDATYSSTGIGSFLSNSDYVVSVLPNTHQTKNFINKDLFKQMKPSCIFMSIGRGETVCEDDLISALQDGQIRVAVLDVFHEEPLPENHPFWTMPNVYVTSHVSGYCVSDKIFEIFGKNYRRFLAGEELMYQVNFRKGY